MNELVLYHADGGRMALKEYKDLEELCAVLKEDLLSSFQENRYSLLDRAYVLARKSDLVVVAAGKDAIGRLVFGEVEE